MHAELSTCSTPSIGRRATSARPGPTASRRSHLVPGTDNVIDGLSCVVKTAGEPSKRVVAADHSLVIALASDPAAGNSARNRPDSIYNRQPTNRMGVVWMLRSELGRAKNVGRQSDGRSSRGARRQATGRLREPRGQRHRSGPAAQKEFPFKMTIAGGQEAYRMRTELAAAKVPVLLGPLSTTAGNGPENTETILNRGRIARTRPGVPFAIDRRQIARPGAMGRAARIAGRRRSSRDYDATPAKLLGLDSRIGTIAVGRDADLVALSGDPFDLDHDHPLDHDRRRACTPRSDNRCE